MADPATQFQQAGIQSPQFTPVPLHLNPPIQLPETGGLWAQVGQNLMHGAQQVFQDVLNSPLNPEVKAELQTGIKAANRASDVIDFWNRPENKQLGMMLSSLGARGTYGQAAPVQAGGEWVPYFYKPPPPPAPTGTDQTKNQGDQGKQPTAPAKKMPTMEQQVSQVSPSSPFLARASTQPPSPDQFSATQGTRPYLSASTDTGPIPTTATGESGYTSEPAQPQGMPVTDRGPVWNPLAPSPQGPSPHVAQAVADSQNKQALAAWQAQNVHPVASPTAFKNWYQQNVSTEISGATYSPTGGVNGEPAFVVHHSKGGDSIVSVSQIAKTPSGRALLATQNPSEMLEHQDNQAQAAARAAAPQPDQSATQPQGGQFWNPQQPSPGPTAAPPAPGEQLSYEELQQRLGEPVVNPNLMAEAGQQAGTRRDYTPNQSNADSSTGTNYVASSDDDRAAAKGLYAGAGKDEAGVSKAPHGNDQWYARFGNHTWYWNADKGEAYALRPEDADHPFLEQRLWQTSPQQWERRYGDSDAQQRQAMWEEYHGVNGVPSKRVFSEDDIRNMPINAPEGDESVNAYLEQARKWKNSSDLDPNDPNAKNMQALSIQSKALGRLIDKVQLAKDQNIDPGLISSAEQSRSAHAGERGNLVLPSGQQAGPGDVLRLGQALLEGVQAGQTGVNKFANSIAADLNDLNEGIKQTTGVQPATEGAPPQKHMPVGVNVEGVSSGLPIPLIGQPTSMSRVNQAFQGGNLNDGISLLKEQKARVDEQFQNLFQDLVFARKRPPAEMRENNAALAAGKAMPDKQNLLTRDANGNLTSSYGLPPRPVGQQTTERGVVAPAGSVTTAPVSATEKEISANKFRNSGDLQAFLQTKPPKGTQVQVWDTKKNDFVPFEVP